MNGFTKTALLGGVCWLVLGGAALAQVSQANPMNSGGAQDNSAQPTQTTSAEVAQADNAGQVEELVVTARRTEENAQQTPLSVSAFSERALERLGARDVTDLQGAVPNLNIVQGRASSNATNIYIRGVGQPDALQTFDPAVGVYVDDVYYARIRGTQFDLLDLERVEVLRGPQGTLYGKNTVGGALKLVTRKPGDEVSATGVVTVGTYDQLEGKLAVSGPITDTISVGVAGLIADRDGYVHDPLKPNVDYNDKHTAAIRGTLAFVPTDRFRADISADYSRDDANLTVGQQQNTLTSAFGTLIRGIPATGIPKYEFLTTTDVGLPNSTELRTGGISANLAYELSDSITLRSITAYRRLHNTDYIDFDATQFQVADALVDVQQKQLSQEFQAVYDQGPLTVVGGVFYLKEDLPSFQTSNADAFVAPFTFLRTINDNLNTKSYAAFANATFRFTDRLRGSVGIRYTDEKKDYFRTTSVFSTLAALRTTFAFNAKESWDDWSPSATLDYQVTDNALVYARYSEGFKSGGFNGRANTPGEEQPYDPETVDSYELGLKSDFLDKRLRVNLAGFYSEYKDFQARVSRSVTSAAQPIPAIDFAVLNAGKLEIAGVELETVFVPVRGLQLDAQVGWLDADYTEFFEQRQVVPGGPIVTVDRSFQRPAFSPKWTLRVGGQYEADLGGMGFVTLGGQARYRSETALAVDNSNVFTGVRFPGMFQDDYWLYDARLLWETPDRRLSAAINWRNIGDKTYKTDAQEFSSVGGIRTAYFGTPETVSLTLTARY